MGSFFDVSCPRRLDRRTFFPTEGSDRLYYFLCRLKNFTLRFFFLFVFFRELGSGFLCVKMQNVRRVHREVFTDGGIEGNRTELV